MRATALGLGLCVGLSILVEAETAVFVDAAEEAGIVAQNVSGSTQKYIVEGMMGGSAFFDYDGDGDADLYVADGSTFDGDSRGIDPTNRLYRNDHGRFADVTAEAGVGDTSWSMGCVVADYDNDGDEDLYVTNYGGNMLFRNQGGSKGFDEISTVAGVGDEGWGTGCTFGDYDLDGDVDLYVANYVDFSLDYESTIPCEWKNLDVYCGPRGLLPAKDVLYRNDGDGTFTDHTVAMGFDKALYGMSATFADFDDDGWPDLFVANDTTPNLLYRNSRGSFEETALMAGVAYNGEGVIQGCMGVALADYDDNGRLDIFVANFADEFNTLYRNEGQGFFNDLSFPSRLGAAGQTEVAWGTAFFDYDNDGDRDLFVANGHTYPEADLPQAESSYRMKNLLFENLGRGRFAEVSAQAGSGFAIEEVSRGASLADFDGDGDLDIFVLNLNARPNLLRNEEAGGENNHLFIRTVGTRSNRNGIGTRITIQTGSHRQHAQVLSGESYLSHHDLRVHFGLGRSAIVDTVTLRWPSGTVQQLSEVVANQVLTVTEP